MYKSELWHWEAEQAVKETESVKAAGGSNTNVRQQTASIRAGNIRMNSSRETKIWTSEQSERSRIRLEDNTEWRPLFFFFISINHVNKSMNKLMVYIFIFIYLKCNMVQKYRRSAAPRYIYKINTPFRQNKLPQKKSDITRIKKKKSKDSQRLKSVASQSIK